MVEVSEEARARSGLVEPAEGSCSDSVVTVASRSARGSALPLVAVTMGAVVAMAMVAIVVSDRAAAAGRAQAAADAVALAVVVEGDEAAGDLARRNGGRVVELEWIGDTVRVVVEVDGARAEAWAQQEWSSFDRPRIWVESPSIGAAWP